MKEKMKVERLGCNDILSEMEQLQVLGGGIGGDGEHNDVCTHYQCEYNTGCTNSGCGTDTDCRNISCSHYSGCNHQPGQIDVTCP